MLPSKGYFSSLNCPFFDAGNCERPHCHFRHCKRAKEEQQKNDEEHQQLNVPKKQPDQHSESQLSISNKEAKDDNTSLVDEALHQNKSNIENIQIKSSSTAESCVIETDTSNAGHCEESKEFSYKPTPIAELNKRHIPVVYAPERPINLYRKEKVLTSGQLKKENLKYIPTVPDNCVQLPNFEYKPSPAMTHKPNSETEYKPEGKASISATYTPSQILKGITYSDFISKVNPVGSPLVSHDTDDQFSNVSHVTLSATNSATTKMTNELESVEKKHELKASIVKKDELIKEDITSEKQMSSKHKDTKVPHSIDKVKITKQGVERTLKSKNEKSINSSSLKIVVDSKDVIPKEKKVNKKDKKDSLHMNCKDKTDNNSSLDVKEKTSTDVRKAMAVDSPQPSKEAKSSSQGVKSKKESQSATKTIHSHEKKSSNSSNKTRDKKENSISRDKKESSISRDKKENSIISKTKELVANNTSSRKENIEKSERKESSGCTKEKTIKHAKIISDSKGKESQKDGSVHLSIESGHSKIKEIHNSHIREKKSNKDSSFSSSGSGDKKKVDSSNKSKHKCNSIHKVNDTQVKNNDHEKKHGDSKSREDKEMKKSSDKEIQKSSSKSKHKSSYKSSDKNNMSHNKHSSHKKAIISGEEVIPCKRRKIESPTSDIEEIVDSPEKIVISDSSDSEVDSYDTQMDHDEIVPSFTTQNHIASTKPKDQFSTALCERWRKARETIHHKNGQGRMRIAHVPNVNSLLTAKDKILAKTANPEPTLPSAESSEDICQPKVAKRIAHVPSKKIEQYPKPTFDPDVKIPLSVRQHSLNNLYEEWVKFGNPEEVKIKAIEEEFDVAKRVSCIKTYQSSVVLAVLRIRKNKGQSQQSAAVKEESLKSQSMPAFTFGKTLYECFSKYLLTEEQLTENGYPLQISGEKHCAYIHPAARRHKQEELKDKNMRKCLNCHDYYTVDEYELPESENDCNFHWGRYIRLKRDGEWIETYNCCGGTTMSEGCQSNQYHVCNTFDENRLEGFVTTPPLPRGMNENAAGIFAMDCEMCYTTKGMELTRCTVIDLNLTVVYNRLVIPDNPILDYCTRFSGITESILKNADTVSRLEDVQKDLCELFNSKTILIGHSLESDLKALKLFHFCVIDTSVIYPHRFGPPFKKALKTLAKERLQLRIQDKETGHDSSEDASACMKLLLDQIKQDAKTRKPRVIISFPNK